MDMLFLNKLISRQKNKKLASQKNNIEWLCIYNLLWNLSVNNIKWEGLKIPSNYIEKILIENGAGAFYIENNTLKFDSASTTEQMYNEPTKWNIFDGRKSFTRSIIDSVYVTNDFLHNPFLIYILNYTEKILDTERTINTSVATHKMPFLIKTNDKKLLTHKNIINQIQNNEIAIFVDDTLNINDFQFFKTEQDFIIDKLDVHKKFIYAEFKELLGFNNIQIEKKERLITNEAEQNDEVIQNGYCKSMLDSRLKACQELNKLFNLSVSCKLNREVEKNEPTV